MSENIAKLLFSGETSGTQASLPESKVTAAVNPPPSVSASSKVQEPPTPDVKPVVPDVKPPEGDTNVQPAATPVAPASQPPPAVTPASKQFDESTVANIVKSAVQSVMPQPKVEAPTMSQEEFEKKFSVAKVTAEDLSKLQEGGDVAVQVMGDLLQRSSRQAVTMSHFVAQQMVQQFKNEIAPYIQLAQQVQGQQVSQEFFKAHADLKDYAPIVEDVAIRLQSSGWKGDKAQLFTKLSEETRRLVAAATKGQVPSPQGGNASQQPNPTMMAPVTTGGQGGAGNSTSSGKKVSTAQAIFG